MKSTLSILLYISILLTGFLVRAQSDSPKYLPTISANLEDSRVLVTQTSVSFAFETLRELGRQGKPIEVFVSLPVQSLKQHSKKITHLAALGNAQLNYMKPPTPHEILKSMPEDPRLAKDMRKALLAGFHDVSPPPVKWDSVLFATVFTGYGYFAWIGAPDLSLGAQWASYAFNLFILYTFTYRRMALPLGSWAERVAHTHHEQFEWLTQDIKRFGNYSRLSVSFLLSLGFVTGYRSIAAWGELPTEIQTFPFWLDVLVVAVASFATVGPLKTALQKLDSLYTSALKRWQKTTTKGGADYSVRLDNAPLRRRDLKILSYSVTALTLALRPLANQGSFTDSNGQMNWELDAKKGVMLTYATLGVVGWKLMHHGEAFSKYLKRIGKLDILQDYVDSAHRQLSVFKRLKQAKKNSPTSCRD